MTKKTDVQSPKTAAVKDLLYQALETEMGGVLIYRQALKCTQNDALREEWEEYLEQTEEHVEKLQEVFAAMELDPEADTPGRLVVRHIGESLIEAMEMAAEGGSKASAEIVAAECVVFAETKDHANWGLLGRVAKNLVGKGAKELTAAYETIEDEEDAHLYHTAGWARELWIQALGMPAMLPPPEEEQKVTSAAGAERAKRSAGR